MCSRARSGGGHLRKAYTATMAPVPKKDIGFAVLIAFNLIVLTLPSERLAGSALASKDESRGLYNSYLANWIEVTKLVLHLLFFFQFFDFFL